METVGRRDEKIFLPQRRKGRKENVGNAVALCELCAFAGNNIRGLQDLTKISIEEIDDDAVVSLALFAGHRRKIVTAQRKIGARFSRH